MTAGSIEGPAAGYSLQDAAAVLGVSVNTLRKRIKAGQVRGERVQRPQGYVWQVHLDGLQPPDQPADDPPIQEAPSRLQQPQLALMQAEAMAAYTRSLLEPLVALVEQQETVIRDQAETIGRQAAELEAARGQIQALTAPQPPVEVPGGPESVESPPGTLYSRLRSRAPWLLLAAILLVAFAVGLPAWVR
jgi:hypothetical protein